jgi:hypothetical protein
MRFMEAIFLPSPARTSASMGVRAQRNQNK